MSCLFCEIIKGNIPSSKIYEDEFCIAILDIRPINKGHILIIPKEHHELIIDYPQEIVMYLFGIAQKFNKVLRNVELKCDGVNFYVSDGESAGQEIFHTHVHVFPRFEGDGFGLKFPKRYFTEQPSRDELNEVAKLITDGLNILSKK